MQQAIVYYTLGSYPYESTYMTLGVKPLPPYPMRPVCQKLLARTEAGPGAAFKAPLKAPLKAPSKLLQAALAGLADAL